MQLFHFFDDLIELGLFILVDFIVKVLPEHRHISGNNHNIKFINLVKFFSFRNRCPCHTGKFPVHFFRGVRSKVVLESDRGICPCLFFHMYTFPICHFFRFQGLMQTIGISATVHHTACKFIDNDNLTVVHHIFAILLIELLSNNRLADVMLPLQLEFTDSIGT